MNGERGGDSERIAPIIPLFGVAAPAPEHSNGRPQGDPEQDAEAAPPRGGDAGLWRSTWEGSPRPTSREDGGDAGTPSERHPARGAAAKAAAAKSTSSTPPRLCALRGPEDGETAEQSGPTADEIRAGAEASLVRKLRSRSLSISEARLVLRGHGLEAATIDDIVDDFCRRSYLDDAVLAGLLVTAGVERKGQGRIALSRALAQRGIPRDVIDGALDELPDDDDERALEFARTKARSLSRLDFDTALRRLVGQLSRRGYNGSVAMTAAKTALREASSGGSGAGVRFVDSD